MLHIKTRFEHTLLCKAIRLVLFLGVIVRYFDILQTNSLFAVIQHMRQLSDFSSPFSYRTHSRTLISDGKDFFQRDWSESEALIRSREINSSYDI